MQWSGVGTWIKNNAGAGAGLIGNLLTGNLPGAVAAGVSLVANATGTTDPQSALNALQNDPATILKLKELALREEADIREHIRAMEEIRLEAEQAAHSEQQETIRSGDNAEDEYVRHTRPMMARQSWYATMIYVIGFEGLKTFNVSSSGASWDLAMIILAPAAAYLGFRSFDKFTKSRSS